MLNFSKISKVFFCLVASALLFTGNKAFSAEVLKLCHLKPHPFDFHLTFPRKSGHMIKFHEGAFHTALDSCILMPNDSSDDYRIPPRTQRYSALPPALNGTAPHGPTPS